MLDDRAVRGVGKGLATPATELERQQAREAAAAIRRALVDPAAAGEASTAHIDMARPRRGVWVKTWRGLPGFVRTNGLYQHDLLPGWQYTAREVRTEMIEDLDRLAATGERPTEATR